MGLINRPARAGAIAVMGLAITAYTGVAASGAMAAPSIAGPHLVALKGSLAPTTDKVTGSFQQQADVRGGLTCSSERRRAEPHAESRLHQAQRLVPQVARHREVQRPVRANGRDPQRGGELPA